MFARWFRQQLTRTPTANRKTTTAPVFQIADQTFSIARSNFVAYVGLREHGWRVSWSIEIESEPKEVSGQEWAPQLSSHSFALDITPAFTQPIDVALPASPDGEPAFMLYTFEHVPVEKARIALARQPDGRFHFNLIGKSGVFVDDQYAGNLPVRVNCALTLAGVVVDEYHFAKAEERLPQFFDRRLFGEPERYENGGVVFKLCA